MSRLPAAFRVLFTCVRRFAVLLLPVVAAWVPLAAAETRPFATDADGVRVELLQPARRVVALAPHLTEVMYALEASTKLIAVSDYSDYPSAARALPRVGNAFTVQLESVLALRPDLVLAWGGSGHAISRARLARAGIELFVSHPRRLLDVATELRAIGALVGRSAVGARVAREYEARLHTAARGNLRQRVFLQLGAPTLYTVGAQHYLGEALRLCGGINVFAELRGDAPMVSAEAVLARRADVVLMLDNLQNDAGARWRAHSIPKVRTVAADLVSRPGPRLAAGVSAMCAALRR